jgi:hypothetical protein
MNSSTPIDKLFTLATTIVVALAILVALSHGTTSTIIKTIGTQWNNSLKAMEAA